MKRKILLYDVRYGERSNTLHKKNVGNNGSFAVHVTCLVNFPVLSLPPPPYLLQSLLPQTTRALQPIFEFECHPKEKVILILGGSGRAGSKPLNTYICSNGFIMLQ